MQLNHDARENQEVHAWTEKTFEKTFVYFV